MTILAVDTALGACSVAILDGETVRAHRFVAMSRGHAEALAPMVEEAVNEAGIGFSEFDRLGVTTGPGTFTGQRVGLAFMRGLRLALKRPLVGVTTLDAMAAAAARPACPWTAVLHEAKRGEVYATLVTGVETKLPVQVAEFGEMMRAIAAVTPPNVFLAFAGTAAEPALEWYRREGRPGELTDVRQPDALWVARLAMTVPTPASAPKPLYLRAPDARLPKSTVGQVELRPGDARDADILSQLHAACFPDAWSPKAFRDLLAGPGTFVTLAEQNGRAIGFALGRAAADEAEILSIGVLETHRRTGIGRHVAQRIGAEAFQRGARILFLEVALDNAAARALYGRLGFRAVGQRKRYYDENGSDALVLSAALPLEIAGLGNGGKVD